MKRALPTLTLTACLLTANAAVACPPSDGELALVLGALGFGGLVVAGALSLSAWALWRLARRRLQRGARFVT